MVEAFFRGFEVSRGALVSITHNFFAGQVDSDDTVDLTQFVSSLVFLVPGAQNDRQTKLKGAQSRLSSSSSCIVHPSHHCFASHL